MARSLLEDAFPVVLVEGEIGNLARPASGHIYLTLKDARAGALRAVQAQKPAAAVPAARRHAGAGPRATDAVRGARRLPADPRFAGGSRRRRSAARVRGAEGEAAGRGPVRRRAQTPPARLGAPAGRADLALWRGGARRAQRAGAALPAAGRGGAAGAGAGCDGGDRKSTRLNSSH